MKLALVLNNPHLLGNDLLQIRDRQKFQFPGSQLSGGGRKLDIQHGPLTHHPDSLFQDYGRGSESDDKLSCPSRFDVNVSALGFKITDK